MKIYKFLLTISVLFIAGSAAFFSVSGIAKLFGAEYWAVITMAGALEFGKLVAASYLHRYWDESTTMLKGYLTTGVFILMIITSMGIFGFLTNAYEQSASELQTEETQIQSLESRKQLINSELKSFRGRREQLINIRTSQTKRLNTITSSDSLNANEIGYLTRQTQDRIETVDGNLDTLNTRISAFNDSLSSIQNQITNIKSNSSVRSKLGPLLFVAREFDTDPDSAVKWFTFMIIFVFDPLAVSLVIALNVVIEKEQQESKKIKNKKPENDDGNNENKLKIKNASIKKEDKNENTQSKDQKKNKIENVNDINNNKENTIKEENENIIESDNKEDIEKNAEENEENNNDGEGYSFSDLFEDSDDDEENNESKGKSTKRVDFHDGKKNFSEDI